MKLKISSVVLKNFVRVLVSVLVFLVLSVIFINVHGQKLNYKVIRNGSDIGWMKLERSCDGNYCKMILTSEIKFRMIVLLTATVFESAYFLNDRLVFSSQYHKMNGTVKVNKQTRFAGNGYEVSNDNEKERLEVHDINFNLLCLYFQEPVSHSKVYCDKQQCFANIEKTGDAGYKVRLPNGNSNCYYYSKGICTKIKIEHTFYSAEIILNP